MEYNIYKNAGVICGDKGMGTRPIPVQVMVSVVDLWQRSQQVGMLKHRDLLRCSMWQASKGHRVAAKSQGHPSPPMVCKWGHRGAAAARGTLVTGLGKPACSKLGAQVGDIDVKHTPYTS